ncbi:hypothetical protein DICPUDRAFT_83036 [Dictyostelium purpureum]|uniref:Uncharacterized protein n=1 Tax=Dictyostelium purpureum TaxID=5786 RepID=F0ZYC6_DICPU|nr:uncharacterized protein DICPUDRAFT_83036 [Dictyostelium purpureum]EGC31054.1 hypothetical protein DICPUDRAFT_83036 [Dictyostelium purpureum]|eukprot:XP_003292413.1 hypothetical protein DICPUDRAFT_83036 [Dictyostelium purpureum]
MDNNNFEQLLKNYTNGETVKKNNDRGINFYYSKYNPEFFKELKNRVEFEREKILQVLKHDNIVKLESSILSILSNRVSILHRDSTCLPDTRCRLCFSAEESIEHLVGGCTGMNKHGRIKCHDSSN